ncbi:hypothetical protein B005_5226 [Nocardiopsis alba ATCC BAA-2165]|uniref:Uncharacterized protein n=1 Tax=Nocardiopsis alba (strain ATCC BAA-2165 / BE74) TaxID=1205910 RepID=J7L5B6_NOCAA|nr:hypothetical protein B005_5226 [Nocardiopsis alba ATCC BAA-2165]
MVEDSCPDRGVPLTLGDIPVPSKVRRCPHLGRIVSEN